MQPYTHRIWVPLEGYLRHPIDISLSSNRSTAGCTMFTPLPSAEFTAGILGPIDFPSQNKPVFPPSIHLINMPLPQRGAKKIWSSIIIISIYISYDCRSHSCQSLTIRNHNNGSHWLRRTPWGLEYDRWINSEIRKETSNPHNIAMSFGFRNQLQSYHRSWYLLLLCTSFYYQYTAVREKLND